jgi:uncharacterized delta-60 repeat protein
MMGNSLRLVLVHFILVIVLCGCAGGGEGGNPTIPQQDVQITTAQDHESPPDVNSHILLGYSLIYVNEAEGKVEMVPVRESVIHLNILKLLEDGPCTNCFKIVGFNFPQPGYLDVNIQIDHPLKNTPPDDPLLYSVFDVRGIMMFQGSHEFPVAGKSISDPALGDGALLNADGYTALYNGSTITAPIGDLQKYYPGDMATPTIPNSDINGYKYFITDIPANNRNAFFADASGVDVQTYSLKLPTGPFVLGYAVDANWWMPINSPVDDPLTDFDTNANCPEAWKIVVTEEPIGDGLTDQGGQTKLIIDVYDWQGKDTHHDPIIECPELFDGTLNATWDSDGTDYARYEVTVSNANLAVAGEYLCLVGVEANENDPINKPWLDLTAYYLQTLTVIEKNSLDPVPCAQAYPLNYVECGPIHFTDCGSYDPDGGDLVLFEWDWDNDGVYEDTGEDVFHSWDQPGTYYVQYRVTDDESETGELDEPIEITLTDEDPTAVGKANYYFVKLGEDIQFNGSDSHDGHCSGEYICSWEWDWENDGVFDDEGEDVTHNYTDTGKHFVQLRVTDDEGSTDVLDSPIEMTVGGNLIWAKNAGGIVDDAAGAVTTLSDDSIVMSGSFKNSATFGQGELNETVLTSNAYTDIFIALYQNDGTLGWVKSAGGMGYDIPYGITSLSDDSTVVTGYFEMFSTFGQGEPNETLLVTAGENDIFVAKYNPDGTLAWAKRAGGIDDDYPNGITALPDGSLVICGVFRESASFGQGEPNEVVLTSEGLGDIFIARYNADGTLAWAKRAGGIDFDSARSVTTIIDNSIIMTGGFHESATFGQSEPNETVLTSAGDYDIFIVRYNPNGTLSWAKRAGGIDVEMACSITSQSDDSIVLTGYFNGSAIFGQGDVNETNLTSAGDRDIFIAKYNPDGTIVWATRAGGTDEEISYSITTLTDNSTILTGYFKEISVFGQGEINESLLESTGERDLFIARYNPDGTLEWAKRAGGIYGVEGGSISVISDNSTVVCGIFGEVYGGSATFGPGESNETILTSYGGTDIFIARYSE